MLRKFTLGAAFGAGYVLGAKAGTQRYEQIMAKARELAGQPAVQDLRETVTTQVEQLGDKAKTAADEALATVSAKVSGEDTVDLTSATPAMSGPAKTGATGKAKTSPATS